jgi:hypothetical protein
MIYDLLDEAGMKILSLQDPDVLTPEKAPSLDAQELLALMFACSRVDEFLSEPCVALVQRSLEKVIAASKPAIQKEARQVFKLVQPHAEGSVSMEGALRFALNLAHARKMRSDKGRKAR